MRYLATLLVILIVCSAATLALAADLPTGERPLTAGGIAYGIARDAAGNLVVTDWKLGEVWRVAPGTGAYTRYGGLGNTLDAQPDGAGDLWLTAYWSPLLTRINSSASPVTKTTWDLSTWDPGRTYKLAGVAVDDLDRVWFSEWGEVSDTQLLYRFDPASQQLCGYTLPGGSHSWYLLYQGPYLWLGDWVQGLLVRFDTSDHTVVYWDTGNGAEPRGLAADAASNLWWADVAAGKLARLDPGANLLTTFTLPDAGQPNNARPYTVAAHEGRIWYAAQGDEAGAFGVLDPALTAGSAATARRRTFDTTETCRPLPAGTTAAVTIATGAWTEPWPAHTWTGITPAPATGWTVYEAPGAEMPYGIAIVAGRIWSTDQAYNKLIRAAIPLAAPKVTIARSGAADVRLDWTAIDGAGAYRVWRGDQPGFQPDPTPDQDDEATSYTHPGALTDPANTYYVVRAVPAGGVESGDSNRTGKFTFALVAGGGP